MQQEWGINASFLLSPVLQQKHAIALGCERWILADFLIIYQGLALYYPMPLSIAVLPVFLYEARHGKCSMAISLRATEITPTKTSIASPCIRIFLLYNCLCLSSRFACVSSFIPKANANFAIKSARNALPFSSCNFAAFLEKAVRNINQQSPLYLISYHCLTNHVEHFLRRIVNTDS
jgi:hypothetical protein